MSNIDNPSASLVKRFAAMIYDGLLAVAMGMGLVLLPASLLITFAHLDPHGAVYAIGILLWGYVVMLVFFGWFWTHGGQTLGMRTWRLRMVAEDGSPVGWKEVWARFTLGLPAWVLWVVGAYQFHHLPVTGPIMLVAGLILLVLDQWPEGWREQLSKTRVLQLPKPSRQAPPPQA